MKLMIASDIHGSAYWCEKMLAAFEKSGAEKLVLLGDILYHYQETTFQRIMRRKVIAMLNPLKDKLCVRGNCDTDVDQMVLDFLLWLSMLISAVTVCAFSLLTVTNSIVTTCRRSQRAIFSFTDTHTFLL